MFQNIVLTTTYFMGYHSSYLLPSQSKCKYGLGKKKKQSYFYYFRENIQFTEYNFSETHIKISLWYRTFKLVSSNGLLLIFPFSWDQECLNSSLLYTILFLQIRLLPKQKFPCQTEAYEMYTEYPFFKHVFDVICKILSSSQKLSYFSDSCSVFRPTAVLLQQ